MFGESAFFLQTKTEVSKISTDVQFMTTEIKMKMLVLSSTKTVICFCLIKVSSFKNAVIVSIQRTYLKCFENPFYLFQK